MSTMSAFRKKYNQEIGKYEALITSITDKKSEVNQLERRQRNIEQAIPIVQLVAQQTQEELKFHISELVSLALAAVFDDPYEFKVNFVLRRGKTEADIVFLKNGIEVDPMTASGGGAVDVAAFALRVALWNLSSKRLNNTIILDEPFRFVSSDYQEKAVKMVKLISKKLNIQFIIVTHNRELIDIADQVHIVSIKNGISSVEAN